MCLIVWSPFPFYLENKRDIFKLFQNLPMSQCSNVMNKALLPFITGNYWILILAHKYVFNSPLWLWQNTNVLPLEFDQEY